MDVKVKDFAVMQGVSESIIYRHIRNNRELLGENVVKKAKATWITDEGQEILRKFMVETPIVLKDQKDMEKVRSLEAENKELLLQLVEQGKTIQALQEERYQLAAKAERLALMEASERERKQELDEFKQEATEAVRRAEAADRALVAERETREAAEKAAQTERDVRAATEQELEAMKAEVERLRARKWYDVLFGKGK